MDDPTSVSKQLDMIADKLAHLRELDPQFVVFASRKHRYELNLCLTEEQISAVEADYQMRLPEGYRQFLLHIGNGGAGPDYGLLTLQESLRASSRERLVRPFPLVFVEPDPGAPPAMGDDTDIPEDALYDLDSLARDSRKAGELCSWVRHIEEMNGASIPASETARARITPFVDEVPPGAIKVADYGCGILAFLVVHGPERGAIWISDPNTSFGCELYSYGCEYYPIGLGGWMGRGGWKRMAARPEKRLDFLTWYEDWLDDGRVQLEQEDEWFEGDSPDIDYDEWPVED